MCQFNDFKLQIGNIENELSCKALPLFSEVEIFEFYAIFLFFSEE